MALITIDLYNVVYVGAADFSDTSLFTGEVHTTEGIPLRPLTNRAGMINNPNNPETFALIGIGPGSHFIEGFGRVSLLRNIVGQSGFLVLNDSLATSFMESCDPESIARVPFLYREEFVDVSILVTYKLAWRDGPLVLREISDEGISSLARTMVGPHLSTVALSSMLADEIYSIITRSGGIIDYTHFNATNCSRNTLMELLPQIKLTFAETSGAANLYLFPDDYISFDTTATTNT
jgi:hypothetical protein